MLARAWPLLLGLSISSSSALADAGTAPSADDARRSQVVASGSGFSITLGQLEDHINKQPAPLRARYAAQEERKALLDNLVRMELLSAEAERRGLGQNPAVLQTLKDGAVQTLLRSEIDDKFTVASITAADVSSYYDGHAEDFHHPAERRASHIQLGSEAEAKALLPEAQKADLHAFGELAKHKSLDAETKLRGGDLAFFPLEPGRDASLRKVAPALRKAVFALKAVGDTADAPVAVDTALFSIVRLTGERPERHVSLAEADSSIRSKLWRERRQHAVAALLDGLRNSYKPKTFSERVDWIKFDDMERRPAGFSPDPLPHPSAADAGRTNSSAPPRAQ